MENIDNDTTTAESSRATAARYEELKTKIAGMEKDFVQFYVNGNKAAGTRVRLAMQELKTLAQEIRTEVQTIKNDGAKAS